MPSSYILYYWTLLPSPLDPRGIKAKVKRTPVQALRLCTGRTGIALPFHDHGTRRGWVVSGTPRSLFTPRKDSVPIVQEAGWAPGPVLTGAENLAPTAIQSPDRPARSQSLYRLRYSSNTTTTKLVLFELCVALRLYIKILQDGLYGCC